MGRSTRLRPPAGRRLPAVAAGTAAVLVLVLTSSAASDTAQPPQRASHTLPGGYRHLVVIYEENHSFDNLYGTWGPVGGQQVEGLARATARQRTQRAQNGTPYRCLLQNDVNLTSPPLPSTCRDAAHGVEAGAFANEPFTVDDHIRPRDRTCPAPGVQAHDGVAKDSPGALPGGCTRDLVHRFYQNRYAIDGGRQDRYVTASDAVGLTMGHYATTSLPIHRYLHAPGAPRYVLADHFFQGAFGGSFLNHQYLIAARAPRDTSGGASGAKNTVLDANGMPTSYPLYRATGPVVDGALTAACPDGAPADYAHACGSLAVNTVQPSSAPHGSGPRIPLIDDTKYPNIGDRLTAAGISWNWYSGGWDDAEAGHPGPLFQHHHQPFNYFAGYAPGTPGRRHLRDEREFLRAAGAGTLPAVSFVKPYGAENEHPGYAAEAYGSDHLVDLLRAVTEGPQARDTLVVVTYDEFGGQWDHLPPPGPGSPTRGAHDAWGPGTRVPALVVSRSLPRSAVDHTVYDTTSILATIERSYGLKPVATRDAVVNDLSAAVAAGGRRTR
ncbi:phospholipase C [Streptomyces sp. NPDC017179]|uniref:phospholipase C n=1 Tax=Streptomyces sp. NPDC017179 TaxID=3364979 RepID=UPI0037A2549E